MRTDNDSTQSHRRRLRRSASSALVALAAVLMCGAGAATANTKGEHCINPGGVDLNQRYGVAATIVAPFCAQLRTGEHWTTPAAWYMEASFAQVPAGFVPAGATPLDDFRAKFVAVRYVVDAGTSHERSYAFANSAKLWTGTLPFGPPFGDLTAVNTITLGTLHPLSKGQHTVDRYWQFSAQHCDGLGTDVTPGANCFPAGETFYGSFTFEVVPASQQK
jgi:hypothetical protein